MNIWIFIYVNRGAKGRKKMETSQLYFNLSSWKETGVNALPMSYEADCELDIAIEKIALKREIVQCYCKKTYNVVYNF